MYKATDYLKRGMLFLNNNMFPSRKKLSTVMIYATDYCNARCKHCYIWNKKSKQVLPLEEIKKIVHSKAVTKDTLIGLEGGEFVLHPEHEEIIKYLKEHHPNFDLLSNCVNDEKLISVVKKYPPKRLYLSLDGTPETHEYMRGVKNLSPKVLNVVEKLKDIVPVSIMFTLTPFNNFDDLRYVISFCKEHNVDLRVGIYGNMEYFDTKEDAGNANSLNYSIDEIPAEVKQFDENYDFMVLYNYYKKNEVFLPCLSIRDSIVIYPNGDIPLCQNKNIVLGNLYNEPLDTIMNKKSSINLHKEYRNCNGCWINFHRKYDIVLFRSMEKILPKKVIELFFNKYHWCKDTHKRYKDLI